ncbi:MAG: phosphatidylglycerophosphatase A family protein [Gammaproteobacteria bacterium]
MGFGANKLSAGQILGDPLLFLAFGFGTGLAKKAPGTLGTLAAVPIYLALAQSGGAVYSVITLVIVLAGVAICGNAADRLGVHDYSGIVWDEIAGFLIAMWAVSFSWAAVVAGFALFRFFDIVKPWPIRRVDREMQGGLGIMMDDVLAGLYSMAIMAALEHYGLFVVF